MVASAHDFFIDTRTDKKVHALAAVADFQERAGGCVVGAASTLSASARHYPLGRKTAAP